MTTLRPSAAGSVSARRTAVATSSTCGASAPGIVPRSARPPESPLVSHTEPVATTTSSNRPPARSATPAAAPGRTSTPFASATVTRLSIIFCQSPRVGRRFSRSKCPPTSALSSNSVTSCPRRAATPATFRPAGPAPTTATRLGSAAGRSVPSPQRCSRPTAGFITQCMRRPRKPVARHSLAPTHRTTSPSRPSSVLRIRNGSAMCARTIATMSAAPEVTTFSAVARSRMRPARKIFARSPTTCLARRP